MRIIATILTLAFSASVCAEVRLPAIFGSHMVLQRDIAIPVWGWADPQEKVTITFNGQTQSAVADASGKWQVKLAPIASGENLSMTVAGSNTLTLDDILIGDVWLCSGQSNMEFTVSGGKDAKTEISNARHPKMRLFTVAKATSGTPLDDVKGQWVLCSPETVGTFSAVGYFFGRDLHKNVGIPVGLIHSSWGGTPAEAWTSVEAMEKEEILKPIVDRYTGMSKDPKAQREEYQTKLQAWAKQIRQTIDPENVGEKKGYASADFDDSNWKTAQIPAAIEPAFDKDFDGAAWLRRGIEIPDALAGKDLTLKLGVVDDWDTTYFNGERIGETGPETPQSWLVHRSYAIPGKLVHKGRNVIAVRVFDVTGPGGLLSDATELQLSQAGAAPIAISGNWRCLIEHELTAEQVAATPAAPAGPSPQNSPENLYNAMIHPLVPFAIKGAIWYQGESNAGRSFQYRTLLPTMITNWRTSWNQGDFPFLIVQLVNFAKDWTDANANDGWAELREAQALTAKNTPNCGIAVGIDVGEAKDIHPKDKQTIGLRLALVARKQVYAQDVIASGPTFKSLRIEGGKAIVAFDNVFGGLKSSQPEPGAFAIAGEDNIYHFAKAKIIGDAVEVWSDEVAKPVAVRYAWGSNPLATLFNGEGLPAIPFRTDDWAGATDKNR